MAPALAGRITRPNLRDTSFAAYRAAIQKHLVPALGQHRLDRLEPEHLKRLHRRMIEDGATAGTAHQVHRTIRTAPGEATRRGHVARNVAALAKPPRVQADPIEPYSVERSGASSLTPRSVATELAGLWHWPLGCARSRHWRCGGPTSTSKPACFACVRRTCALSLLTVARGTAVVLLGTARRGLLWDDARGPHRMSRRTIN
jgi:Phage integrase, N-terminal SAM-like domain